ncbi:zinc finger CCCH domain-containing protein 48-like [Carica papaya]|uniref:zinc finger CCCH domain-containing protein 48-like n=1 Tax=Carica papaya TaxID=3649 RepID=UPI000B8CF27F|nr:zinc finger CCCH domain-containing protein 48-like [Carica papaya]
MAAPNVWRRTVETPFKNVVKNKPPPSKKVCSFWLSGRCVYGDRCRNHHPPFLNTDGHLSLLGRLNGHKGDICGICLPTDSDKLLTGYRDGTVRIWDCNSGKCVSVLNLQNQIGSMHCEGSWIFYGLPNLLQARKDNEVYELDGPVGQVYAITSARSDTVFAGAQNGDILVWRGFPSPPNSNPFRLIGTLKGHTTPVTCLTVGGGKLYSGSMDGTVRVWDTESFVCINTVEAHSDCITSLVYWGVYLITSSRDKSIKIWATIHEEGLQEAYTHQERHSILALHGMNDANNKPVICCSCEDSSVRIYELPSFMERGRLLSKRNVHSIQSCPYNLFFTGDGAGTVTVWNWLEDPQPQGINGSSSS